MFVTNPIGIRGEETATDILRHKGYKILEHNWRMGHLEVDIIAENKKEIVFVEVKGRTTAFSNKLPEEYVNEDKKRRIIAAANAYIKYHKVEKTPRFDIIGVLIDPDTGEVTYQNHLENAYTPHFRTVGKATFSGENRWHYKSRKNI